VQAIVSAHDSQISRYDVGAEKTDGYLILLQV
jgi:hypothetical protein